MDTLEKATAAAGARMIERLGILRGISQTEDWLERTLFSPAAEEAAFQLKTWMEAAGMTVGYDELTNIYGYLPLAEAGPDAPRIHIGSHYDTVVNAGAFDGALGVVLAIAVAEAVAESGIPFRHNLSALAFCDEEGVRFNTTFLGSAYLSGQFEKAWLDKKDPYGKSLGEWLVDRAESIDAILHAQPYIRAQDYFLEAHIEQGPVLEGAAAALGVFTRIAAQLRSEVVLVGCAGHAGTTPARLRKDPLPVAAEIILAVDALCQSDESLRATVGHIEVSPNASNVIPGQVKLAIDLRYPNAEGLNAAHLRLIAEIEAIVARSRVGHHYRVVHGADDTPLDPDLTELLAASCQQVQGSAIRMFSGAGHDSMKIASVCPAAMLAVRCRDGLSHHPDEFSSEADCLLAFRAMLTAVIKIDQTR
ncbi:MAG: Zn-dependent hydrolase [Puniceicoccaceae bacterium]|nr:MAG: Zn-dependent hydrolase [Puniceicoccaceae bacterium]